MKMSLPEKLAREIHRATKLRAQYVSLREMPQVNVEPLIVMIDASLEAAMQASGSNDIAAQIRAVEDLEGYTK